MNMNTLYNGTIEHSDLNKNYIKIGKNNKSNIYLNDIIDRINFDKYFIVKSSGRQRCVSIEEFISMKNVQYFLYDKNIYNKDHILNWTNISSSGFAFVTNKFPPFNPNRIKIFKNI